MGRYWIVLLASGCADLAGIGDPAPLAPDAPDVPCVIGGLDLCLFAPPQAPLVIDSDFTINTSVDCNLVVYAPPAPSVCVLYAQRIEINAKLTATGTRPLVIAASDSIVVRGTVDVSSYRQSARGAAANDAGCVPPTSTGTYGGGAGGSFGGKGGDGGKGSNGDNGKVATAAITLPAAPRGGCPGGGASGGAVWLAAGMSIEIAAAGKVLANGAGGASGLDAGSQGGGSGGGGSGGFIRLAAQLVRVAGTVTANGGGGSEGSDTGSMGASGTDGMASTTKAPGGFGGSSLGGDGGAGGAGASPNGVNGLDAGTTATATGGGGGGGVGFIQLVGAELDVAGTLSPPKT